MNAHKAIYAHAVVAVIMLLGLMVVIPSAHGAQQPEASPTATVRTGVLPAATSEPASAQTQATTPASEPTAGPDKVPLLPEALSAPEESGYPPEYLPLVQKTASALKSENFTFYPIKALDPFMPFVAPETSAALRVMDDGEEPRMDERPLTPLQKMTMGEIERGLKAISWGALGRRAVIEDSTGKGYIVAVGTPAGERNGVVTQIFNDRLVIQQEIWDKKARKRVPQDFTVKLSKKADKSQ